MNRITDFPSGKLLLLGPTVGILAVSAFGSGAQKPKPIKIEFNRDIRPILSDNCFRCHGADRGARKADLRLDQRDSALKRSVIVPGNPEKSGVISRINALNSPLLMPPAASHKTLTAAQRQLLANWIKQGAVYQDHWAYLPITKPAIPSMAPTIHVSNPIDNFILAKLNEKHISPSPRADNRTLIRRLALDLTGLPPTPAEVEEYIKSTDPKAYEKLVDRLLSSPNYGQRMAVPWLDVVRYADTVGYHGDQNMNAWAYRDYVIDSFNQNKPFDQFTVEQIAGDLLPNPTPEQRTATCYNRLNMMTREGGAQPREYFAKYQSDRVRTLSMAWLGSTMGCAECHNHKYDPFTAKDFYSMEAFFADLKQWGVYEDYGYTPEPELRGINNDSPFPPEIKVTSPYLVKRIQKINGQIDALAKETYLQAAAQPEQVAAYSNWKSTNSQWLLAHPDGWEAPSTPIISISDPGGKNTNRPKSGLMAADVVATAQPNGEVALIGNAVVDVSLRFKPTLSQLASIRLELLQGISNRTNIFRNNTAVSTIMLSATITDPDKKVRQIPIRFAAANNYVPRFANGFEILGIQRGWVLNTGIATKHNNSTWVLAEPIKFRPGSELSINLPNSIAARIRVSVSPFVPEDLKESEISCAKSWGGDDNQLYKQYLWSTAWNREAFQRALGLQQNIYECHGGETPVMVVEHIKPKVTRIFPRGNWLDESGEVVSPAIPAFLNKNPNSAGLSRLDLAKWLISKENPLTARAFVNRLWKQFFGNGLSAQVDDLGGQGEWPSHPELLDWLASEFQKDWNIKRIVKLFVMSDTYCRSSSLRPELKTIDPNNRLLASQNPRRLEAEFIRDNALAISGLLVNDLGGPPIKPYQPAGYYANLQFPDRPYNPDPDERQWRRSVYIHWQRTFVLPMLINFDAPSREDCVASRNVANTPQQALTLLNDPIFVEASRAFADRVLSQKLSSDTERINAIFQLAVSRQPKPAELNSLFTFLKNSRTNYTERPGDAEKLIKIGFAKNNSQTPPSELAAWTDTCRVVLNLQETMTRY